MNIKTISLALCAGIIFTGSLLGDDSKTPADKDKTSFALGMFYGSDWKRREITADELNFDKVVAGIKAGLSGNNSTMTEDDMRTVLNTYQTHLSTKAQEKRRLLGEKNKKEGDAFLAENKKKPGMATLESGLQYKVIAEGSGESPKPEDTVTVKYRGTSIDGTEFDSSAKAPNGTVSFQLNRVIRGWTEGLTKMKSGAKWQLFIPSDLAYGERGSGPNIGPNAVLIFDVELVSFQAPAPPAPAQPLTSDIIKVPSLEEMKKGAKIETIKAEEIEKAQKQQQQSEKKK